MWHYVGVTIVIAVAIAVWLCRPVTRLREEYKDL